MALLLKEFEKRCKDQMDIELHVRDSVKKHIAETGYDAKYGARPLKRAIQNVIEDPLAEKILSGEIHAGDPVTIGFRKGQISFDVKN